LQRDGTIFSVKIPAGSAIVADANGINLGASGVTANTYGSATASAVLTVNDKGLVTSASTSTITPAVGSITGLGSGVGTFLGTPSSANLEAAITGATGSGALVFGTTPTLSSPTISTALTLNATTYTYGTNAATAHRTALSINNVDNTSDLNKPVSTATQSALDAKANLVDPVRTTLSGNGSTSVYAISGAESLTNPSALIVAIDGALQEPSVDYTVASGNITFTSPLANGSKAVVVSPVNTVQVGQVTPSDGSVTSAKIAGGVTLSDPVINNSLTLNATSYVYGAGAATAHKISLGFKNVFAVSDESKTPNTTNYADDSELFLTLEAGTWLIKSNAFWSNADNTVGVRAQVAFSGTMDITKSPIIAHVGSSNDSNSITLASTSSRPVGALTSTMPRVLITATAARNGIIQIEHTVSVSVAGVYSLQWGQGTASPTLATIRKAGSFITATKLN
jgi:hypothetical protein